jgi:hypothetical protein
VGIDAGVRVSFLGHPDDLGPTINTTLVDAQPYIAADRLTRFFMSNRPGGCGGFDLYVTTRTKLGGPDKDGE